MYGMVDSDEVVDTLSGLSSCRSCAASTNGIAICPNGIRVLTFLCFLLMVSCWSDDASGWMFLGFLFDRL